MLGPSIALPSDLIKRLIAHEHDPSTIKVVLTVARLATEHAAPAIPVSILLSDPVLRKGLQPRGTDRDPEADIIRAIDVAVARGFLVRLRVTEPSISAETSWVALATPEALATAHRDPARLLPKSQTIRYPVTLERPNAFALYEQNIGPLTPLIAEQIAEALERYPEEWVESAIVEAVHYGRRNWRYIQRILEIWATKGRGHETNSRDQRARQLDPEKYLRGKYAPLFSNPE